MHLLFVQGSPDARASDSCTLQFRSFLPDRAQDPKMVILTISNPRIIVLRRFVNNITYEAGQMSGAMTTFHKKKAVMWGPGASRPQVSGPGAATGPSRDATKQQVPRQGQDEIQPVSDARSKVPTRQGQPPGAKPSEVLGEAPAVKSKAKTEAVAPAPVMLLVVELQNTQVCGGSFAESRIDTAWLFVLTWVILSGVFAILTFCAQHLHFATFLIQDTSLITLLLTVAHPNTSMLRDLHVP